jgi:hypothetical protein
MVDGVIRVQDGELLGSDGDALRRGADRFNARLRVSAGRAIYAGRPVTEFYGQSFPDWEE